MKAFLKSLDERVLMSMEIGWERPATLRTQWSDAQNETTSFNSKTMNAISKIVSIEEFKRISKCRNSIHYLEYCTNCA